MTIMNLNDPYLKLTTDAVASLVETPTSVRIDSDVDSARFLSVFKSNVFVDTLTSEKALYAAMSVVNKPLPTIDSLFQ